MFERFFFSLEKPFVRAPAALEREREREREREIEEEEPRMAEKEKRCLPFTL